MAGYDNIRAHTFHTTEEARIRGANGGRASGESKRKRKTFRDALKMLMDTRVKKGSPLYRQASALMTTLGLKGEPTGLDLVNLGVFQKAIKGDTNAAEFIRDTIGEKPTETFEDITPQSPIILGMIPQEMVDKAKAEREERNRKDEMK